MSDLWFICLVGEPPKIQFYSKTNILLLIKIQLSFLYRLLYTLYLSTNIFHYYNCRVKYNVDLQLFRLNFRMGDHPKCLRGVHIWCEKILHFPETSKIE
jgi:hypothetical protein